jgi:protoporphyrinogen oxidase
MQATSKDIVILGAGPAGLTAALEILRKTTHRPVIIEATDDVGGICRPLPLGNGFIDFGGHRFHTNSQRIKDFWLSIMPIGHEGFRVKKRCSKLYFQGGIFDYPVLPTLKTFSQLGLPLSLELIFSYLGRPRRELNNLEDFFIATYGERLYQLFFEEYTAKIWGRSCREISHQWARERLAGPRVLKEEGSFLYPKGGPGAFWKAVAGEVQRLGGVIQLNHTVTGFEIEEKRIKRVITNCQSFELDECLSTLAMGKLLSLLNHQQVVHLPYRSLISVNLILNRNEVHLSPQLPQWIYINQPGLKAARLQFYRAWDESMSPGSTDEIVGIEFFVNHADDMWNSTDEELMQLAIQELKLLGFFHGSKASDGRVLRYREAYPCYWQDYDRISEWQRKIDSYHNLFSFGRQGLHRYMNMDQTMMSALRVVDYLHSGGDRAQLWSDFQEMHLPE